MSGIKKLAFVGLGVLSGIGAATGLAIVSGVVLGFACQLFNPSDPSAGSAAEIMILLLPLGVACGAIAGAILGWKLASRRAGN